MSSALSKYLCPDLRFTKAGNQRRVGFELEFSGISLAQATQVVASSLNARVESESLARNSLTTGQLGEFIVEIDWDFLKTQVAQYRDAQDPIWLEPLSQAAEVLVPIEVVCPPIDLDQLAQLNQLVTGLREAGALGTEESLLAAYGVHINTEAPALDLETLTNYVVAYALLQWWLVERHEVNQARRISPYIDLYPEAYLISLLEDPPNSIDQFIDRYLEHNPTRNRALDLLPILAEIDEDRVRSVVDDPKINARPAFHYRLPNCQIEKVNWSLADSWNIWCVVERLANDSSARTELGFAYQGRDRPVMGVNRNDWVAYLDTWLGKRS